MDLKLMFSHFMTGGNTNCHSENIEAAHFIFGISNQVFQPSCVDNPCELIPLMEHFVNF